MPRFDRVYILSVGIPGGKIVHINNNLRITFDIAKDNSKNPNRSKINVYNLSPETRAELEKPNAFCLFKAGYIEEDDVIEIYRGDVHLVYSKYDGPNVVTEIELGEGLKAIRDIMLNLSYKAGVTSTSVLKDIAGKMKVSLTIPSDAPTRTWANGLAFHGAARTALDKVCAATGLSWSFQGGALQIVRAGGNTNRTVVVLGADSGLLGHPERVRKGAEEVAIDESDAKQAKQLKARSREIFSSTREEDGWKVRSLLLPSLVPNDRVMLRSRSVEGVFTIKSLRHVGDSHGGDWLTELNLLDPKPAKTDTRDQRPAPATKVKQSNTGKALPLPPPQPIPPGTVTVVFGE